MRNSASNQRSLLIGILLASLSAGCLIAFTLLAGSAEYPTGRRVVAADPERVAAPVTLSTKTAQTGSRDRRAQADRGSNDPSDPIVLGIQVMNPEGRDGDTGRDGRKDRDRKDRDGKDRDGKDRDGRAGDRNGDDKDPDGDADGPSVAKPTTEPPETNDRHSPPYGNAYGHDKKASPPGLIAGTPASSSMKGGPPAHATAAGHVGSTASTANGSSHSKTTGPPAHANAHGHSKPKK